MKKTKSNKKMAVGNIKSEEKTYLKMVLIAFVLIVVVGVFAYSLMAKQKVKKIEANLNNIIQDNEAAAEAGADFGKQILDTQTQKYNQ